MKKMFLSMAFLALTASSVLADGTVVYGLDGTVVYGLDGTVVYGVISALTGIVF